MTDQAQATAVQVCQKHGKPDDLVVCPFSRCQVGRVPQWYGNGMPAGTRACTVCDGHGRITRAQAEESRRHLFGDDTWQPFCICHAFGDRDEAGRVWLPDAGSGTGRWRRVR